MRYLGIDFGEKRIGLALSDQEGKMAFPFSVISGKTQPLEEVTKVIESHGVQKVVIGESNDFKGRPNEIMKKITKFADSLKSETGLPVFFEPEFLTSAEAQRIQGKNAMHDASAAAIILQSYLDKI